MSASDISAWVALVVSIVSTGISILTYYQNGARMQFRKLQLEKMKVVAGRALILLDQVRTIIEVEAAGNEVNSYLFPSIQGNSQRLEDAMDEAIGCGLMEQIVTSRPNSLPLYTAFAQALVFLSKCTSPDQIRRASVDDHLTMGLIRLLEQCLDFGRELLPDIYRTSLDEFIRPRASIAWNYISKSECH